MFMSELITDFIEYLEIERGRSPRTAENYERYLERFIEFNGDLKVEDIRKSRFGNIDYGLTVT